MIKTLGIASLFAVIGQGVIGPASAQNYRPPMTPPIVRYVLPFEAIAKPPYFYEGRSIYRPTEPEAFFNESDEKGYRSGLPENPHTGQ